MKTLAPASVNCRNCQHPLTKDALYCPNCSQKNTDGRISVSAFIGNFLETIFNVDSKIFRTLRDLFIPGKLTEAYFEGRHKSYLHPVRFLLVVTVLLIALLNSSINTDLSETFLDEWKYTAKQHQLIQKADTIRVELGDNFPSSTTALDSFYNRLAVVDTAYQDSIRMPVTFNEPIQFLKEDLLQLSDDELIEKYFPDASLWTRLTHKQMIKFARRGQSAIPYMVDKLSWAMLIAIPFFAFFLKLLYARHERYYIEHLVFTLHMHIFLFTILIFSSIISRYLNLEILSGVAWLGAMIYIPLAMKRIYKQTWFKTLSKYLLGNFIYWFIVGIGIVLAAILGFFLF